MENEKTLSELTAQVHSAAEGLAATQGIMVEFAKMILRENYSLTQRFIEGKAKRDEEEETTIERMLAREG